MCHNSLEQVSVLAYPSSSWLGQEVMGRQNCTIPVNKPTPVQIDVLLGLPWTAADRLDMNLQVNAVGHGGLLPTLVFGMSRTTSCAVCGRPCIGRFMGHEWSMEMPPCPVEGKWTGELPLEILSQLPSGFDVSWHTSIRRGNEDETTALEYDAHVKG